MADLFKETKELILRAAEEAAKAMMSEAGIAIHQAIPEGAGVLGASGIGGVETTFATGYDGSATTMPAQWDISVWDGPDLLV